MAAAPDASRVEARIELTQADVLHALQGMHGRPFGRVTLYAVAMLALGGAGLLQGFDAPIVMAIAVIGVLLVSTFLVSPRRMARQYFEDIVPEKGELAYIFTPTGFEVTAKHSRSNHDYQSLKRYVSTRDTLLLYSSGNIAQIVPLRAFDASDRERVLGWVKAQVPPAPKRSSKLKRTLILWGVLVVAFGLIWWFLNP